MSINYGYSTVYDPAGVTTTNATNVAVALKTALLANAAYSLVEDVTVGSSSYRWIVIKCDHTVSSSTSADWYFIMYWVPGTSPQFNVLLGETYTGVGTSARTLGKVCLQGSSTSYTAASDGSCSATYTQAASGVPTFTGTGPNAYSPAITMNAGCEFFYVVYPDHFVFGTSVMGYAHYFGAFTSLVYNAATTDPMPLTGTILQPTVNTNASGGGLTRMPGMGSLTSTYLWLPSLPINYGSGSTGFAQTWASGYIYACTVGYTVYDALQNNTLPMSESLLLHYGGLAASLQKTVGVLRGKYNSLRMMMTPPSGMVVGDTISYNGTHWMCVGVNTTVAAFADLGV